MSEHLNGASMQSFGLLDRCVRLSRAYAQATRRVDAKLSALHGLSFGDFMILYHLQQAPGARLRRTDLADCMGLTASAVTKSLLPLEKIGWVARQSDPRDARVGYASLSAAGVQVLADAGVTAEEACEEAYRVLRGEWEDVAEAAR